MKNFIKCPKMRFANMPYLSSKIDCSEELSSATSHVYEDVLIHKNIQQCIDVICDIRPYSNFKNVAVNAQYRNELGEQFIPMSFNLYDGSFINMNGVVSHIDVVATELVVPYDTSALDVLNPYIVYTKIFPATTEILTLNVIETENCSGLDTLSNVYHFGGCFKPNMPLSDIQPYLFYIGHNYNGDEFINIISASEFLNKENNLLPSHDVTFESLSSLYDDIINGKIHIEVNNTKYQSIFATKNTLTSSKFIIKFKTV